MYHPVRYLGARHSTKPPTPLTTLSKAPGATDGLQGLQGLVHFDLFQRSSRFSIGGSLVGSESRAPETYLVYRQEDDSCAGAIYLCT